MFNSPSHSGPRPLLLLNGRPVWFSMLLTVLHVVMLMAAARTGSEFGAWMEIRVNPSGLLSRPEWPEWWQWGTYFFSHSLSGLFLLDMYILWVFGTQIEKSMGAGVMLRLYVVLIFLPSALVAAALATGLINSAVLAGSGSAHFCLYLAVACLEPEAEGLFRLKQKVLAGIFFAIYALHHLFAQNGLAFVLLIANAAAAYAIMRRAGMSPRFGNVASAFSAALPGKRRKSTPGPLPYEAKLVPRPILREERVAVAKIDAILEKISRSGLDSLTVEERKQLERASTELKRQDE